MTMSKMDFQTPSTISSYSNFSTKIHRRRIRRLHLSLLIILYIAEVAAAFSPIRRTTSSISSFSSLLVKRHYRQDSKILPQDDDQLEAEYKESIVRNFFLPKQQQQQQEEESVIIPPPQTKTSTSKKLRLKLPFFKYKSHDNEETPPDLKQSKVVTDVHSLRNLIVNSKIPLSEITLNLTSSPIINATTIVTSPEVQQSYLKNHEVIKLIAKRHATNSTPGNRSPDDTAHLSLSIEGGGMRGAVSAGMAAAIASLGLSDTFDSIYGSSAGSIVGAYMVSRQMCVDVYTEVLPAAGDKFASKSRVIGNLVVGVGKDVIAKRVAARAAAVVNGKEDKMMNGKVNGDSNNQYLNDANMTANFINNGEGILNDDTTEQEEYEPQSLYQTLKAKVYKTRQKLYSKANETKLFTTASSTISKLRPYLSLPDLHPGMNISFVIDGIMDETSGLRPFDISSFKINDKKQPLFVISSSVRNGSLETVSFCSRDLDFWEDEENENFEDVQQQQSTVVTKKQRLIVRMVVKTWRGVRLVVGFPRRLVRKLKQGVWYHPTSSSNITETEAAANGIRREKTISTTKEFEKDGFFACLAASMLVPGAAGPPIGLLRSKHRDPHSAPTTEEEVNEDDISTCFDAFCYEPIPYRSAVQNGATHVLALRSRPDGCEIPTKPTLYEKVVAPVYFRLNGLPQVGEYFENGGQQYRYLEDVLTLEDGLVKGCNPTANLEDMTRRGSVPVPPTDILYGTPESLSKRANTKDWKHAHLLPIVLPYGSDELPTLNQDKGDVTDSVRSGYATAFDMLAPVVGLKYDKTKINGAKMAELLFPKAPIEGDDGSSGGLNGDDSIQSALERPVRVKGDIIEDYKREEYRATQEDEEEGMAKRSKFVSWILRKRLRRRRDMAREAAGKDLIRTAAVEFEKASSELELYVEDQDIDWLEAEALLAALPGFKRGKLSHLSGPLANVNSTFV